MIKYYIMYTSQERKHEDMKKGIRKWKDRQ